MEVISEVFLETLRASLENRKMQRDPGLSSEEWGTLYKQAERHHVAPMIYEAVKGSPAEPAIGAGLMSVFRQTSVFSVFSQASRTEEFKKLYTMLCSNDLRPCVVKGIVCRDLYRNPDARMSSDEDILVPDEDFLKAHELLREYGLEPIDDKDPNEADEIGYRGKNSSLYIELHKSLFSPQEPAYGELNRFFTGVHARLEQVEACGLKLWTMEPTDNLLYLILHSFKHFLHGGFGIRQVCDICLYAGRWGSRTDWSRLLMELRSVNADGFAAAVFAIGCRHLGFDRERACMGREWQDIKVDEIPMLEDLLEAGVFGSDITRRHSSNITLGAVAADKEGKQSSGLISTVFLPLSKMADGYPYLKKYPVLLPAAWVHRIIRFIAGEKAAGASESYKLGQERTALLRQYGIVKSKKRFGGRELLLFCAAVLLIAAVIKLLGA